jgi:aminobenzoyl-glutamate transport protein
MTAANPPRDTRGFLGAVERVGNALPDPVFLFLYLVVGLVAVSAIAAAAGWSVLHPTTNATISALSLLSAANLQKLFVDMPTTFTHFHPLGYVLVVMLGAGVAERSGLLGAAMTAAIKDAPKALLTPAVAFVAMMGNLAADAAYVVLVPLAGVIFAAAGRHPVLGIVCAFAGVAGGFSANLLPGQLDALLFGITEAAVETLNPGWNANIAGNWYFIAAMLVVFLPVIWIVTDLILAPRLGKWGGGGAGGAGAAGAAGAVGAPGHGDSAPDGAVSAAARKGLARAGMATLGVIVVWLALVFAPGTPLIDETAQAGSQLTPFYRSLVAAFFLLFLAAGWAYGSAVGVIKGHRDLVGMMAESMKDMGYYLVLAFVAAHFVSMFQWSNLGLIIAVTGANALKATGLPAAALLAGIVVLSSIVNLFVGSASAKWALLAPVLVPMLMLLGISPEMSTAAYRVGDSATNIVTPLMVYFPLVLTFAQRWSPQFGLGSLLAAMIPYSFWLLIAGVLMTFGWVVLDLPLGPGAVIRYAP